MKIKIDSVKINNEWDYQKGYELLKLNGIDGKLLNNKQIDYLEEKITLYMWKEIKKYFPDIEKYCNNKTGNLNKISYINYNTNIICIHGNFYMQYIYLSNNNNWIWESIKLKPYRFIFNNEGYLKKLFKEIENKFKYEYGNLSEYDNRYNDNNKHILSSKILDKPIKEEKDKHNYYYIKCNEFYKNIFDY